MEAKLEVLAAKLSYEMCKALTPAYAWKESAAETILLGLFKNVLGDDAASSEGEKK